MSSPILEPEISTGAVTYVRHMPGLMVSVGSNDGPSVDMNFTPVAFVVADRLVIYHGVKVYLCRGGIYQGAYRDGSIDQELIDLLARVRTTLGLRGSGRDNLMLRSEPPTTVLAALTGLPISVRYEGDFWRPEVVTPRFVRIHLQYTHMLMSMTSLYDIVDRNVAASMMNEIGDGMGLYVRDDDSACSSTAWQHRELQSLIGVRHVVVYP